MSILVTRPSPAGEILVQRLCAMGKVAIHAPLIDFYPGQELELLPEKISRMALHDCVFFLSQHAVQHANALLHKRRLPWPKKLTYYAIGRTTALAFHQVSGLPVDYPRDKETSETLLCLPSLQQIAGKHMLILRGNGGRELLAETLSQRGAQVSYCECYQRRERNYDGSEQSAHWYHRGIDTVIITSGEMLQQLYALVPDSYRSLWLLNCRLIVVSERLAQLAREQGWQDIRVADNADNDALIRAL